MGQTLVMMGKGGVGKTTSAASLGHALSLAVGDRPAWRCLLVDLDAQASLSDWLAPGPQKVVAGDVLRGREQFAPVRLTPNLDLLPTGGGDMAEVERELASVLYLKWQHWLSQQLAPLREQYDLVVLDTPRGLDALLTVGALIAADHVVVPFDPSGMGYNALREVLNMVRQVGSEMKNPPRKLLRGVLPTRVVSNTNVTRVYLDEVSKTQFLLPVIRQTVKAMECVTVNELLAVYAPTSSAAEDYSRAAEALAAQIAGA